MNAKNVVSVLTNLMLPGRPPARTPQPDSRQFEYGHGIVIAVEARVWPNGNNMRARRSGRCAAAPRRPGAGGKPRASRSHGLAAAKSATSAAAAALR